MPRNLWTPAETAYLRQHAGQLPYAAIAAQLGRSRLAVLTRANRLGLVQRRPWTRADLAKVRRWYGKRSVPAIAQDLGRSLKSVYLAAAKLGLTRHRQSLTARLAAQVRRRVCQGWCNRHIGRELNTARHTICHWRRRLGLPAVASGGAVDSCPRCKAQTRAATARQLERAGLGSLAEVRSRVFAERAVAAGWPAWCRPREVQMLDALHANGPMTRKELAAAIGMPWKGSRRSLTGRVPGGSYLAHLIRGGLVVRLGQVGHPWKGGDGRGRRETYYALALDTEKGRVI